MIAFHGAQITYAGNPAGDVLFSEMADGGVCFVWRRLDGVSERADFDTAEAAELGLMRRVADFYEAMN